MSDVTLDLDGVDLSPHSVPRETLTPDVPGVGGVIKRTPDDFIVEEIPLYEPEGSGEHAYLCVRRRSMTTLDTVRLLATHFRVPRRSVGYAGLKDKHAVTTQVFSVRLPTSDVSDYPPLHHDRAEIVWASRHLNKLRRGHLRGNRFAIRIREVGPAAAERAREVLSRFERLGAPARFGPQRFGHLERNHLAGRALILGDHKQFLDLLLGPCEPVPEAQAEGRAAYARGDYLGAIEAFPASLRPERDALRRLAGGASHEQAALAVGRVERSFFGSAFQSAVFNALLDERQAAGTMSTLLLGDIAMVHEHRAVFDVDKDVLEAPDTQDRLRRIELSPTGPMWGRAMRVARHDVAEQEREALRRYGLTPSDIDRSDKRLTGPLEGARRPLRIPVTETSVTTGSDEVGDFIRCDFTLPRGAFATTILEEVMKCGPGADESRKREA